MGSWIVVVDDEVLSLTSAKTLLGSEDLKISCLRSGPDLLKFMEKNNPDLILLDVVMPGMDGFETLDALRRQESAMGRLETPVIFLTGDMDDETEHRGLRLGASDYIHKPFNKDLLIRRIQNTIQNSRKIEILTESATIDKLTGLLNKASGIEKITDMCSRLSGALTILDLDNFKLVNDLFGHEMGDNVLMAFADILRSNTRNADLVCRIGGDEFLAFLTGMEEEDAACLLTSRLNEQLAEMAIRLMGADHGIPLGISAGAVMVPEYGRVYEDLFGLADESLYKAKENGKHCCHVYSGEKASEEDGLSASGEMERISKILEERNEGREALVLGIESFSAVYHFLVRFNKKYGCKAMKVLFLLSAKSGSGAPLENIMNAFGELLKKNLSRSDLVLKNKASQYLVVLSMLDETNADGVVNRIIEEWKTCPESKWCEMEYITDEC